MKTERDMPSAKADGGHIFVYGNITAGISCITGIIRHVFKPLYKFNIT